ncbi:MAG: hypothetical protein H6584_05395 [Flavobacteriales bacterium]|nr:hypothetical protein [Flavobacteriales bacterium]
MKYFIITLYVLCIGLLLFNSTQIDYNDITSTDNTIPAIGIVAPICAIILLAISHYAQKIKEARSKT